MAQPLIQTLSQQYGIDISSPQQLKNGNILMQIAYKVLYSSQNEYLQNKLFQSLSSKPVSPLASSNKVGNNVIIVNSLLKHIKSDSTIQKETWVKELTFYNLLENQDILHKFINWMIEVNQLKNQHKANEYLNSQDSNEKQTLPLKHKKSLNDHIYKDMTEEEINSISSNRFRNIEIENHRFKTEEPEKQQHDFDNLYFASNLKSKPIEDPIVISPEKGDKIVRKGSFKLLKPKVSFGENNTSLDSQPKQLSELQTKFQQNRKSFMEHDTSKASNQSNFYEPDELKEISMIEPSNNHPSQNMNIGLQENFCQQNSQIQQIERFKQNKSITSTPVLDNKQTEIENRKTIPKNLSKPPLCRSSSRKNKQNFQTGPSDKEKTIQQSLKKKNFFNFSQNEDIVSTFNYELIEPKKIISRGNNLDGNSQSQKFGSAQKSRLFSKIKELKSQQKNEILQYMSLQGKKQTDQNIIEDSQYQVRNQFKFNQDHQQNHHSQSDQQLHQNSSKILKLKNHFLQKELYKLEKQLIKEQDSIHDLEDQQKEDQLKYNSNKNYQQSHKRSITSLQNQQKQSFQTSNKNSSFDSAKKSNRKISKIHLHELQQKEKELIIDWLDTLHFVDKSKLNPENVFLKFKDGTKFVQLCNHYIGRAKPLPYFSSPKKNAQIHSNFSKVFDYLKSYSQWEHPEILFAFELFIPYPQETPIWNLLFGMFKLLTKRGKNMSRSATKNESLVINKDNESSRKNSVEKQFQLMEDKSQNTEMIEKATDLKTYKNSETSRKIHSSSHKKSNFSKPIEFVKEIPDNFKHNDLVQQNDENLSCGNSENNKQNQIDQNIYFEGYKNRYMRKTLQNSSSKEKSKCISLETPKKIIQKNNNQHEQSFLQPHGASVEMRSIRKSSSKKMLENQIKKMQNSSCKLLSAKKSSKQLQKIRQIPKITLNMQMKVQKILRYFKLNKILEEKNCQKLVKFELLQDPIRNGTLINIILGKFLPVFEGKFVKSPSSIEHCRQNYMTFFAMIKNKYGQEGFEMFEKYLELTEDVLKGEKTIFYGIAYGLVQLMQKKGFKMQEESQLISQNNVPTFRVEKQKIEAVVYSFCKNHIEWIRYLESYNQKVVTLKIRTEEELRRSLNSGIFIYAFSQNSSIKPIYLNPCNVEEKQANLKKIICYLIQNRIMLQKEDFFGVKAIVQMNFQAMNSLLQKLIRYTVTKYGVGSYHSNHTVNIAINDENQNLASNRLIGNEMMKGKSIALGKYLQENHQYKNPSARLETTTAEFMNETNHNQNNLNKEPSHPHFTIRQNLPSKGEQIQQQTVNVQIPWMRKLGFMNCSLSINNGQIFFYGRIILCRLISKLTRTNIKFNENISTDAKIPKAQCLGNIRKAIKLIPGFKFDDIDVFEADQTKTIQVYDLIKEKFRNTYQMTKILVSK